jgi:hypothetical protein
MNTGRLIAAGMVIAVLVMFPANTAYTYGDDTIQWLFTNHTDETIQIEFTTDPPNRVWPGDNKAYTIPPHSTQSKTLNCVSGQKICYGGWIKGNFTKYWGAGNNGDYNCDNCCAKCGSANPHIGLNY